MSRQAPARRAPQRTRKPLQGGVSLAADVFANPPIDDKRALIEAHTERRATHPVGNVIGMYVGVAICTILILVGWAIALPRTLLATGQAKPDAAISAVTENGAAFGGSFSKDGERLKLIQQQLEAVNPVSGGQ